MAKRSVSSFRQASLKYNGKIAPVWKKRKNTFIRFSFGLVILGITILTISRLITGQHSRSRIFSRADVPLKKAAIVFGAGLWKDGSPTPILKDRVKTAADLYFSGKVEKLLMSGDNHLVEYNEPLAMKSFALTLGVPADVIVLDYAGRRTYDTCQRARSVFGLDDVILVTQSFHLPRALYICTHLGLRSVGVNADLQVYRKSSLMIWKIRELFASLIAIWDVHIGHPLPLLEKFEPIFP